MPDTIRTEQELLTIFADNATHAITPQSMRDFVVSVLSQSAVANDYAMGAITDSVAITTIAAGSYVDINAAMVDIAASDDFSVAANDITFLGPVPKLFAIDATLTAGKTMGSIESYTVSLAINGILNGPTMGISFTNGVSDNVSLHHVKLLSNGDDIKLQLRGDTTSDDVIVTDLILRLTEIKQ